MFGKLFVCFSWSKIELALFILKSSLLVAHQFSNRARFQFQLTRQKDNLLVLHGNLRFKLHSTAFRFLKVHLYIYTMLSKFRDFGITKHLCVLKLTVEVIDSRLVIFVWYFISHYSPPLALTSIFDISLFPMALGRS